MDGAVLGFFGVELGEELGAGVVVEGVSRPMCQVLVSILRWITTLALIVSEYIEVSRPGEPGDSVL